MRLLGIVVCGIATSACAVEPDEVTGQDEQQGLTTVIVSCGVAGADITGGVCQQVTLPPSIDPVLLHFEFDRASPIANPFYFWVFNSGGGALKKVKGCGLTDKFCDLNFTPGCDLANSQRAAPTTKETAVALFISPTRNFNDFVASGLARAIVPNAANCDPPPRRTACLPPVNPPALGIYSERCGGLHAINWTSVPNSLNYQVQTMPKIFLGGWERISDEYAFPGITADIPGQSCRGDATTSFWARVRACNDCGCSAWSNQAGFDYFRGECS